MKFALRKVMEIGTVLILGVLYVALIGWASFLAPLWAILFLVIGAEAFEKIENYYSN